MRRSFVIPASIALTMLNVGEAGAQGTGRAAGVQGTGWARVAGFNVVLVLASQQADLSPDGIPSSASKALADLKDFLPYRSYKLLDTQWSAGSTQLTRLRGLGNVEYALSMETNGNIPTRVTVSRFILGETNGSTAGAAASAAVRINELAKRRLQTEQRAEDLSARYAADAPQMKAIQRELLDLHLQEVSAQKDMSAASQSAPVINTSFTMDVGETVVVGTSRLQGDKALIVLLTAVPKK